MIQFLIELGGANLDIFGFLQKKGGHNFIIIKIIINFYERELLLTI